MEASRDEAAEHPEDDPACGVVFQWKAGPPLSKAKRARLLEILFGPDEEGKAA